ncbi:Pvc16 family protein [Kineosporia babensis]|uniref:Pvc16 family protein n=1 Tax=Kineosporia babensis TaxID=499548 RepID=A0A9X1NMN6_9ACTN|nr:Pvc16 family protein [Kineosporia babensis]MCD5315936.1 Pvc16 family protein [Kineosporia babensis]
MFDDLDASLAALLSDPAAPPELRSASLAFETPGRDYRPGQPTLNLFLHDVSENRALRDPARLPAGAGEAWSLRMPDLRMECTYLLTAWSPGNGAQQAAQEHRLIGLALRWLGRFAVLEEKFLRGSLAEPAQPYPLPIVLAGAQEGRSNAEFWNALGIAPRVALSLSVTVGVSPFDEIEVLPAVQHVHLRPTSLTHPELSGQVLDADLTPVADAAVTLTPGGETASTGKDGGFTLPGVAFGEYTLKVQAGTAPAAQFTISYRRRHQTVTAVLSPT